MRIKWDETGKRLYETGVDRCVVYPFNAETKAYDKGFGWNGLTGVQESPSGADPTPLYADNIKYLEMRAAEEFGATVTAYMYPDEFATLDGSAELTKGVRIQQQTRGMFGMTYRSLMGSDDKGTEYGYKIHCVYGATVSPSEVDRETVNDDPDAAEFSWELTTTPVEVTGMKPTSHLIIDSTKCDPEKLAALEKILYGTDKDDEGTEPATDPRLPLPDEIKALMAA